MSLQGPTLASSSWGDNGKQLRGLYLLSFDDECYYYYTSWNSHMLLLVQAWLCKGAEEVTDKDKEQTNLNRDGDRNGLYKLFDRQSEVLKNRG